MSFYRIPGDDRIGKLINVNPVTGVKTLEYFESPTDQRKYIEIHPNDPLDFYPVPYNKRLYVNHDESWKIGRFLDIRQDGVTIILPNKVRQQFEIGQVFLPNTPPDPSQLLEVALFETPFLYERRKPMVEHIIKQRSGCLGLTGLLSSAVEIAPHQVEVIGRVLRDPIQRYILADEVGLGKTIEAGAILRQHIIDNPNHNDIIIITPDHLIDQWKEELKNKFFLQELYNDFIKFYGYSQIQEVTNDINEIDLLIIDEAHQIYQSTILKNPQSFQQLIDIAAAAQKVLLLSGTPALNNELEFLAMLSILDPQNHSMEGIANFRQKVELRTEIGKIFKAFLPQNPALDQIILLLCKLIEDESINKELMNLYNKIQTDNPSPEYLAKDVSRIRMFVSEKYRIHHRLLRNSRNSINYGINKGREGIEIRYYEDDNIDYESADGFIQSLIGVYATLNETEEVKTELIRSLIGAYFKSWSTLKIFLESRRNYASEDETEFIENLLDIIPSLRDHTATKVVQKLMEFIFQNQRKVLIFASDDDFNHLSDLLGDTFDDAFIALIPDITQEDYNKFASDLHTSVILCKEIHQQGLNLQNCDPVICHYSLPFSPNELEQRIGRVDRFGSSRAVLSLAFLSGSQTLKKSWLDFLDKELKVFSRSIANLQYMLDEILTDFSNQLKLWGVGGINNTIQEYGGEGGKIERALLRINNYDTLNSLDAFNRRTNALGNIQNIDEDYEKLSKAIDGWIAEVLQFQILKSGQTVKYRFTERTLMTARDFIEQFPYYELNEDSSQPYAFKRSVSLEKQVRLARIGDEFFNAIEYQLKNDDRGTTFGMIRVSDQIQNGHSIYIKYDFILQADYSVAQASNFPETLLRKEADLNFQPATLTIVLDKYGMQVSNSQVLEFIDKPYNKYGDRQQYRDYSLNPARWNWFKEKVELTDEDWLKKCSNVTTFARMEALEHFNQTIDERIESYQNQIEDVTFVYGDRPEYKQLIDLKQTVLSMIENYDITVLSCGVIILASSQFGGDLV